MILSISTADLYMMPFRDVLEIYRKAGYENVELAGYWQGGPWEVAQHLKGIPPRDVLKMIHDSGLQIASFHDMGGVIEDETNAFISSLTYHYLECETFPCLVFHTPHKKNADAAWWRAYESTLINDLVQLSGSSTICIENSPPMDGYYVPLIDPHEMRAFLDESGFYANVDTTHYAQCGIDLKNASEALSNKIKTVHLSDYNAKPHAPIGSGTLDLSSFIKSLDMTTLYAITIESNLWASNVEKILENATAARELVLEML